MRIGFTGTRWGLTPAQLGGVLSLLSYYSTRYGGLTAFHHGDCIGADAEAHILALALCAPVEIHPSNSKFQRAFCKHAKVMHPELPPLERNKVIVDTADLLIACPQQEDEILRSGTWHTVRYARRVGKGESIHIIRPDDVSFLTGIPRPPEGT